MVGCACKVAGGGGVETDAATGFSGSSTVVAPADPRLAAVTAVFGCGYAPSTDCRGCGGVCPRVGIDKDEMPVGRLAPIVADARGVGPFDFPSAHRSRLPPRLPDGAGSGWDPSLDILELRPCGLLDGAIASTNPFLTLSATRPEGTGMGGVVATCAIC